MTHIPDPSALRVAVRVDAGRRMGTGHLMRCLTLANELRRRGSEVVFVVRRDSGFPKATLDARGYTFLDLPARTHDPSDDPATWLGMSEEDDAEASLAVLRNAGPLDWIVTDHYGIGHRWHTAVRHRASHLMTIDDLADRNLDVDLLVDPNPGATAKPWLECLAPSTTCLLGPRYALIDHRFREVHRRGGDARRTDGDAPRAPWSPPDRILVTYGGSDPGDLTRPTVDTLLHTLPTTTIVAVVGRAYAAVESLLALAAREPRLEVHVQTSDMPGLLTGVDVAVGAGGVSLLERLAAGIPSITVEMARNQRPGIEDLAAGGIVLSLGPREVLEPASLHAAVLALGITSLRRSMIERGQRTVDGRGVERIVTSMGALHALRVRPAEASDAEPSWRWRNDPEVRRWSKSQAAISISDHLAWHAEVLADPDRHLLVGEDALGPVGVVRYEIDRTAHHATVSIYLVPGRRGGGLGSSLLVQSDHWLLRHEPDVEAIEATVLEGNAPSHRLFRACGYHEFSRSFVRRLPGDSRQRASRQGAQNDES